ncbi:MAG: hypothetical protein AAFQ82_05620 [Myxococcota bacterium]
MCTRGTYIAANVGQGRIEMDACMASPVLTLNAEGVNTLASCCGHGEQAPSIRLQPFASNAARIDLLYQKGAWRADWESLIGSQRDPTIEARVSNILDIANRASAAFAGTHGQAIEHLLVGAEAALLETPFGRATVKTHAR